MQFHRRSTSSAARPAKQLGGGCLMLFGVPFLLAGLGIAFFWYLPTLGNWWSARNWEEVPCWIEHAELKSSRSSKGGTTYRTEARYRYRYAGRTYFSEEVGLMGGSDNIGTFQTQAHAELQAHAARKQPFRCYVNPHKPEQAVLYRDLRWGLLLLTSLFPTLFPLAGLATMGWGLAQTRDAKARRLLEARHPEEPWRWRHEWAGEVITPQRGHRALLLVLGGWLALVHTPLAAAIVLSGEIARTPLAALALLPLLVALILLFFAWKAARARAVLGRPGLWLRKNPVSPGETLEGELRFDRVLSPLMNVDVRLLCQRHITRRSAKGSSTTTKETIWEQRETLPAAEARREITGSALPLRLAIPRGLPCTVVEDAALVTGDDERHVWTLEVAPAGTRQAVVLPLPVFLTRRALATGAGTDHASATGDELAHLDTPYDVEAIAPGTEQLVERLRTRGVGVEFDADGVPTLIDCPPRRMRGVAVFMILFGVVWFAAFFGMMLGSAPFIFQLVWGITAPLILGSGLWLLVHHRRVELAADEMRIIDTATSLYTKRQSYAPRHFTGFSHDSNMQSGNQFYYRVRGETTFGKKLTLIDGITESVTAETLAARLEQWRNRR